MTNHEHITEAPQEQQLDLLLEELAKAKESLADSKAVLKQYKVKSDRLTQLKTAQKEMKQQIDEEKERIESELYEDPTYEKAKNDELTFKNVVKEKSALIREAIKKSSRLPELQTQNKLVRGEQLKLQFDFEPKVYLNGIELK